MPDKKPFDPDELVRRALEGIRTDKERTEKLPKKFEPEQGVELPPPDDRGMGVK